MKTKAVIASAVVLVLLFVGILYFVLRHPTQPVTVRHVKSVQSVNVTIMTFEVTKHTADVEVVLPWYLQVRNGTVWSNYSPIELGPDNRSFSSSVQQNGMESYTFEMPNLPSESVVRLQVQTIRPIRGVRAMIRWFELKLGISSYDPRLGPLTMVVSEEWVETGK
jgi:hypothetical protein